MAETGAEIRATVGYPTGWQPMLGVAQPVVVVVPNQISAASPSLLIPVLAVLLGIFIPRVIDAVVTFRARYRLVAVAMDEIDHTQESFRTHRAVFEDEHNPGQVNPRLLDRLNEDEKYYPYIVDCDSTISVLGKEFKPTENFMFLQQSTLKSLYQYQQSCDLLSNQLNDLSEDTFTNLSQERKVMVFKSIIKLYNSAEADYQPCRNRLEYEYRRRVNNPIYVSGRYLLSFFTKPWKATSHYITKNTPPPSGPGA